MTLVHGPDFESDFKSGRWGFYLSKNLKAKVDPGKVFDGIHGHINELDAFLFNNIDLIEKARVQIVTILSRPESGRPDQSGQSGSVDVCQIWTPVKLKSDLEKADSENQRLRAHIAGQR